MAKSLAIETALMPSILDRLLDPDSGGTLGNRGYGLEKMVAAVRCDLEEVLNTRRSIITLPEEYPELIVSPLNFGLPDFGSIPTATHQQHDAIGDMVAEAISLFEPRLRDVRVHLVQEPTAGSQQLSLRFQIEARLRMDPFPDVSFETVLELTTGLASIKAAKS